MYFYLGAWEFIIQILEAWWKKASDKGYIRKAFLVSKKDTPAQDFHVDHKTDILVYNNSEYWMSKTNTKPGTVISPMHDKPDYKTWIKSMHFSGIIAMEGHTFFRHCSGYNELTRELIGEIEEPVALHSMVFFPGNTIHSGKRYIKAIPLKS